MLRYVDWIEASNLDSVLFDASYASQRTVDSADKLTLLDIKPSSSSIEHQIRNIPVLEYMRTLSVVCDLRRQQFAARLYKNTIASLD